jgi:hypothetical protein
MTNAARRESLSEWLSTEVCKEWEALSHSFGDSHAERVSLDLL